MADQTPAVMTYVASGIGVYLAPECTIHSWAQHIVFVPLKEKVYVDVHMITKRDHPSASPHALRDITEATTNISGEKDRESSAGRQGENHRHR